MKWKRVAPSILLTGVIVLAFSFAGTRSARAGDTVTVFAAASTTNAVTDIGRLFTRKKMGIVKTSFASSSTVATQIENGAPANIFISANKKWMDYLAKKKRIDPATRFNLLGNRIVLIAPADSKIVKVTVKAGFDLSRLLGNGMLAMGNPDYVPAGIYGRQALETLDVWKSVRSRVARARNVRAALALVERGEAPLGVVYATDAQAEPRVTVIARFPADSHPPIVYPVAEIAGRDTPAEAAFLAYLDSPAARAIFAAQGFGVIGD